MYSEIGRRLLESSFNFTKLNEHKAQQQFSVNKTISLIKFFLTIVYSETLNKEYIERIQQMSYSSLSDNGMLQIFSL